MATISRFLKPEHVSGKKYYTYSHILIGEQYPFYVGIGTNNLLRTPYARAKTKSGRNKYWRNYTKNKKYLIVICSESDDYEQVKQQEIEYISILGKKIEDSSYFLVNITDGGDGTLGTKHTEEHKQRLREKYRGEGNPRFGKEVSQETRDKMSISREGRIVTDETKKKLKIKALERGYMGPIGGLHHKARVIHLINNSTKEILSTYDSIRIAAISLNLNNKNLNQSLLRDGTCNGLKFIYGN